MTIIKQIESSVHDIVQYTSAFTEHYTKYIAESNKPSKRYNKEMADTAFRRAHKNAQFAITACLELGLDPALVCMDQVNFMSSYFDKAAAKREGMARYINSVMAGDI